MPLRDRVGWERCESGYYCGVETDFSDDVHSLLSFHVSNGGFDYILAPLMNPSYRPSLVEGNSSITQVLPVSGSDLVLAPSQWSSHVVGKISSWIDLDSEDEVLRMDSETTLKQEIAWATHLSLQACLLPTPKGTSCANYARCVNQILQGLTNLQLWLRVPLVKSDGDSGDATSEGLNDSWELWNSFRLLCEHDSKLSVALDVMSTLPSESSIRRWMGESVRAVIVSTDSFLTNARGYPCLSRRHQKLVTGFFDHAVQVVIYGKPVHNVSKALDSKSESTQKNPLRSYLDYLAFLFKKMEPLPEQERLELSYRDFLQAPLQPLMDNLEAQTYETFERDSIKYIQYQRAIAKALVDRVSDDKASELTTVLMVVGAGRGPLVRASLQATEETDRKLKVYAVEKNPNAVVTLHNLVKMEGWEDIVTIISCDMRFWNAPEQADILVSELLDSSGDNELSPECLDRAQRFLKPDGISIPSSYTSLIQPVKASKLYNDVKARKDLAHFETAHVVNMHSVARHTFPRRMGFFTRMLFKRKKRKRNIPDEAVLEEDPCRDILHPPGSNNKYRTLVLDNGMSVLLVSSDAIEDVAAAVAVKCGSFADPPEMQGLAHLLEHVLLLGSRTYPVPNQFKDFVHKHCGEVHAVTELDHSVFSMRVDWEYIVDALKMFADIFSHPVMDIELIEKELTTIDSEFDLHKFKDIVRLEQLMCHTALETNVFHRFTWGNKDSLSQCDLKSLRSGLKKLFAEYYIASNMKLVISFPKAKLDFDDVEDLVKKYFVNLNNTKLKEGIGSFPKYSSTKEIWKTDRCYVLESLEDAQTISLSWVLPPCQYNSSRPEKLILFLLSQENEGSLCFLLKSKGWVLNFKCSVGSEASFDSDGVNWSYNSTVACQLFVIKSDLTNTGWEKRYEMVGFVFQYLNLLRVQHPSKELIDQYKTSLKMKYYGLEYDMGNPCFFGQALAANMLKEPTIRALIMDYVYDFGTHEDMQEVLKKLTPKNMRVDFSSKSFTRSHSVFETVPYFNAKFRVEEFPSGFVDTWENIDVSGDPSLYLPALNKFFPSRFFEDIALCNERDSKVKASNFVKCFDGSSAKLFLSRDATSLLAEASFNLYIEVGSGIKAHMKAFIFMEMLKEDLSVIFLNGEDAHINTSLSFEDNSMVKLRFHGFHEKLNDFITEIWKMIKSYIPREKCFKDIMEKMQREFISRDLSKQANQMLSARMKDGIDLDAKFEALESVTFEDIEHLTIFSKIRIVGVCSGNFSKKESVELLKVFDATGDFVIPNEPERKIELTPGIPLQINAKPKTESETNSLAMVFFQMSRKEDDPHTETAFLVMLKASVEEYLYQQLRQKKRLGYDLGCDIHLNPSMRGFYVYVVSSIYQPESLLKDIYTFTGTIGKFWEDVDDSCFESYKKNADNLLPQDSGICHELIHDVSRIEGRMEITKTILETTEKADMLDFCERFFDKEVCSIDVCISAKRPID